MSTLSVQSSRHDIDHDEMDREFSERDSVHRNTALGISLSGQNIIFAEVEKKTDHFVTTKMGVVQTKMKFGSGIEGVERNVVDLYSYINGCLEDNAIRARRYNLSLNTQLSTLHRMIVESNSPEQDLESFIKWELSKQLLDEPDQYILNTARLNSASSGKETPMLVVGIRRRIIETLAQVLEKTKIMMTCIDIDILCSHAAYEMNYDKYPDGLTVLAEIKPGVSTLLLCEDYDILQAYQFNSSNKATPQKVATLLNAHLDNLMHSYSERSGESRALGRVLLTSDYASSALRFVEPRFNAETINPLKKVQLPVFEYENNETEEEKDEEKPEEETPDYSPFAEAIGAALKLIV